MDNRNFEKDLRKPLQLIPEYKDYVWGGKRLRPGNSPTAESWVVYEWGTIATEPFAGKKLAELTEEFPELLLGNLPLERTDVRFPLLIKLLDSADWLSLQVHPNDEQAKRLEGPGYSGKTEAWHVIEAEPNAAIIAGFRPGTEPKKVEEAIRKGTLLDYTQNIAVKSGETLFIQPGTLHSIGPGLLLYEVQQNSNLTYRVYDWDRPPTKDRMLHIDKSLVVVDPRLHPEMIPLPYLQDGSQQVLCRNPYFTLAILYAAEHRLLQNTRHQSFHALTMIAGSAEIIAAGGSVVLERFETALVPAACDEYEVKVRQGPIKVLLAYVD